MSALLIGTWAAVHGGAVLRSREDAVVSWLPYRGASPVHGALAVSYERQRVQHRLVIAGDYTGARSGPAWTFQLDGEPRSVGPSPFVRGALDWTTGWTVAASETASLGVGFGAGSLVDSTAYDHGFTGVFAYSAVLGAGPAVTATWRPEAWVDLGATAWIPAAAWVARSPYAANDDAYIESIQSHNGVTTFFHLLGDGAVRTLNQLQAPRLDLQARARLSERWALSGGVRTELLHLTVPRPLLDLSATVELGVAVRL